MTIMKSLLKLWISICLFSLAAPAPLLGSRPIEGKDQINPIFHSLCAGIAMILSDVTK
jgi:hypothetical protein